MRKPADPDAQIKALQDDAKSLKERQTTQVVELVVATGGHTLALEPLAGVLLTAVERSREEPEAVRRWTERGAAFLRGNPSGGGRGKRNAGRPAAGPANDGASAGARSSPAQ